MLYRRVVQRIHNGRVQVDTSLPGRGSGAVDVHESPLAEAEAELQVPDEGELR
jgi:hypothetical protein